MNLGNTISTLRQKRGLKQSDLAEKCQITQAYLSNIEHNKKEPIIAILKLISLALEIPLPVLFFLSMDEEDVPENKKQLFSFLSNNFKPILINNFVE